MAVWAVGYGLGFLAGAREFVFFSMVRLALRTSKLPIQ